MQDKVSVMLVEDEYLIASMVNEALDESGFDVTMARNGTEAWQKLDSSAPPPALVTDINAGEGPTGWEIAHFARDQRPDIAVIYMTGAAARDWPIHGVSHSVLIPKPFAPSQIVSALSHLLRENGTLCN